MSNKSAILSWTFAEYEQYKRGRGWFIVAAIIAGVLFVYSFVTRNFLFAVLVVMFAVIIYFRQTREPSAVKIKMREEGIDFDGKFFAYDSLGPFWIVEREGTSATLYILTKSALRPRLNIPLKEISVDSVRQFLCAHLQESDERDDPTSVAIGRALKL